MKMYDFAGQENIICSLTVADNAGYSKSHEVVHAG